MRKKPRAQFAFGMAGPLGESIASKALESNHHFIGDTPSNLPLRMLTAICNLAIFRALFCMALEKA
jgi:hypothetical protein